MNSPSDKQLKEYRRWGVEPPSHDEHGEDSFAHPISDKLVSVNPRNWRMEGPGLLVCDTDIGAYTQNLGPNVICLGTDKKGLPILKELLS